MVIFVAILTTFSTGAFAASSGIVASGGGIVKPGADLVNNLQFFSLPLIWG